MKKSSLFLLVMIALLSYFYLTLYSTYFHKSRTDVVFENTEGGLKFPQIGDLYLLQDIDSKRTAFFKIVGNPKSEKVAILKGYHSEKASFDLSPAHKLDLIINSDKYDPTLQFITRKQIVALNNNLNTNFKIYRRSQKPIK